MRAAMAIYESDRGAMRSGDVRRSSGCGSIGDVSSNGGTKCKVVYGGIKCKVVSNLFYYHQFVVIDGGVVALLSMRSAKFITQICVQDTLDTL
jgi:hypothetical protein